MNFTELLEKYKRNEATPEEAAQVSEALERHEAIDAYLGGMLDDAGMDEELPEQPVSNTLRRGVNRRLRRIVLMSVAAVVALAGAVWLGRALIFQINDAMHYNPNEGMEQIRSMSASGQFYLDVRAYTELHYPGYQAYGATATALGNGNYAVAIDFYDRFMGNTDRVEADIVRGKLQQEEYEVFPEIIGNGLGYKEGHLAYSIEDGEPIFAQPPFDREYQVKELSRLPGSTPTAAYFTFRQDLNLEELAALLISLEEKEVYCPYAAFRGGDGMWHSVGFTPSGSGVIPENFEQLAQDFPGYIFEEPKPDTAENRAVAYEAHIRALLHFLENDKEFLKTMADLIVWNERTVYGDILQYLDENGVSVYGVLLHGSAEALLELEQDANVDGFFVENVKFSSLMKREQ